MKLPRRKPREPGRHQKGAPRRDPQAVDCPHCGGTGKVYQVNHGYRRCRTCGGTGKQRG